MPRLSEKYVAGFMDADGTMGLQWHKGVKSPQLVIGWSQKTSRDEVLYKIQEVFGGSVSTVVVGGVEYSRLTMCGPTAKKCLNRIKKYLVIKRHYAEVCLEHANKPVGDVEATKAMLKAERRRRCYPLPNFPPRKWLAGYFDGDGCVSVNRLSQQGSASLIAHIAASNFDVEGIEIIHKAFGGTVHDMRNGACRQWRMALPPSKAKQFFGYFGKHSVVKRDQILFVLGCAEMGHYRNGKSIKAALKHLKTQEQRLSDWTVTAHLKTVTDAIVQQA